MIWEVFLKFAAHTILWKTIWRFVLLVLIGFPFTVYSQEPPRISVYVQIMNAGILDGLVKSLNEIAASSGELKSCLLRYTSLGSINQCDVELSSLHRRLISTDQELGQIVKVGKFNEDRILAALDHLKGVEAGRQGNKDQISIRINVLNGEIDLAQKEIKSIDEDLKQMAAEIDSVKGRLIELQGGIFGRIGWYSQDEKKLILSLKDSLMNHSLKVGDLEFKKLTSIELIRINGEKISMLKEASLEKGAAIEAALAVESGFRVLHNDFGRFKDGPKAIFQGGLGTLEGFKGHLISIHRKHLMSLGFDPSSFLEDPILYDSWVRAYFDAFEGNVNAFILKTKWYSENSVNECMRLRALGEKFGVSCFRP